MSGVKTGLKSRREQHGERRSLPPLNIAAAARAGADSSNLAGRQSGSHHAAAKIDMAALTEEAKSMSEADLLREVLNSKLSSMEKIKSKYESQLMELFFLQSSGNMMELLAWKKKPNKSRDEFMIQNRLEDEEDLRSVSSTSVDSTEAKATGGIIQTPGGTLKATISRKDMSRITSSSAGVSREKFFPTSASTAVPGAHAAAAAATVSPAAGTASSAVTPAAAAPSARMRFTPLAQPTPSAHASASNSIAAAGHVASILPHAAHTATSSAAIAASAAMVATPATEEDIQESRIIKRISDINNEGLWPACRLPLVYEPRRRKTVWDYMLEEMELMAVDFFQELRWKKEAAKMLAHSAARHVLHQEAELLQRTRASCDDASRNSSSTSNEEVVGKLKCLARTVGDAVKKFWNDVQETADSREVYQRRMAMEEALEECPDDDDDDCGLAKDLMWSASPSDYQQETQSDDDDETTICKAEQIPSEAVIAEEVRQLHAESELSLDEVIHSVPEDYWDSYKRYGLDADLAVPSGDEIWSLLASQSDSSDNEMDAEEEVWVVEGSLPAATPAQSLPLTSTSGVVKQEDDAMDVDEFDVKADIKVFEKALDQVAELAKPATDIIEKVLQDGNAKQASCKALPLLRSIKLHHYQMQAIQCMNLMHKASCPIVLADEMSLGSRLQIIAFLSKLASDCTWGPHLIVVPAARMPSWQRLLHMHCPAFKLSVYCGDEEAKSLMRENWRGCNTLHVCLTSYSIVTSDAALRCWHWQCLYLDQLSESIGSLSSCGLMSLAHLQVQHRIVRLRSDLFDSPNGAGTGCSEGVVSTRTLSAIPYLLMPEVFSSPAFVRECITHRLLAAARTATLTASTTSAGASVPSATASVASGQVKTAGETTAEAESSNASAAAAVSAPTSRQERAELLNVISPFAIQRGFTSVWPTGCRPQHTTVSCPMTDLQSRLYTHAFKTWSDRPPPSSLRDLLPAVYDFVKISSHPDLLLSDSGPGEVEQPVCLQALPCPQPCSQPSSAPRLMLKHSPSHDLHTTLESLGMLCTSAYMTNMDNSQAVRSYQLLVSRYLSRDNMLKPLAWRRRQRGLPTCARPLVHEANHHGNHGITNNVDLSAEVAHACDRPTNLSVSERRTCQQTLAHVSRQRCHRCPVYGADLRRCVSKALWTRGWYSSVEEDNYVMVHSPFALIDGRQAIAAREHMFVNENILRTDTDTGHDAGDLLSCAQRWREGQHVLLRSCEVSTTKVVAPIQQATTTAGTMQDSDWLDLSSTASSSDRDSMEQRFQLALAEELSSSIRKPSRHCRFAGKLLKLREILEQAVKEQKRVLVFLHFPEMLDILSRYLRLLGFGVLVVHQSTPLSKQEIAVEMFNSSTNHRECLLVDTRAACTLPLPSAASIVIQYNAEWNLTRLHHMRLLMQRLAAHHDVASYTLVGENSVEETLLRQSDQRWVIDGLKKCWDQQEAQDTSSLLDIMHGSLTSGMSSSATNSSLWLTPAPATDQLLSSKKEHLPEKHRALIEEVQETMDELESRSSFDSSSRASISQWVSYCHGSLRRDSTPVLFAPSAAVPHRRIRPLATTTGARADVPPLTLRPAQSVEEYANRVIRTSGQVSANALVSSSGVEWEKRHHEAKSRKRRNGERSTYPLTYPREGDLAFLDKNAQPMPVVCFGEPTTCDEPDHVYPASNWPYFQVPMPEVQMPRRGELEPLAKRRRPSISTKLRLGVTNTTRTAPPTSMFHRKALDSFNARRKDTKRKTKTKTKGTFSVIRGGTSVGVEYADTGPGEWTPLDDWVMMDAAINLQKMSSQAASAMPGHQPNWYFMASAVNRVSRLTRKKDQCLTRFFHCIQPREEAKEAEDVAGATADGQKKPKNKIRQRLAAMKAGGEGDNAVATSCLAIQDHHMAMSRRQIGVFKSLTDVLVHRQPTVKPLLVDPFAKNSKHMQVLQDNNIDFEKPSTPSLFANQLDKQKQANDKIAASTRALQQGQAGNMNHAQSLQRRFHHQRQQQQQQQQQLQAQQNAVAAAAAAATGATAGAVGQGQQLQGPQQLTAAQVPGSLTLSNVSGAAKGVTPSGLSTLVSPALSAGSIAQIRLPGNVVSLPSSTAASVSGAASAAVAALSNAIVTQSSMQQQQQQQHQQQQHQSANNSMSVQNVALANAQQAAAASSQLSQMHAAVAAAAGQPGNVAAAAAVAAGLVNPQALARANLAGLDIDPKTRKVYEARRLAAMQQAQLQAAAQQQGQAASLVGTKPTIGTLARLSSPSGVVSPSSSVSSVSTMPNVKPAAAAGSATAGSMAANVNLQRTAAAVAAAGGSGAAGSSGAATATAGAGNAAAASASSASTASSSQGGSNVAIGAAATPVAQSAQQAAVSATQLAAAANLQLQSQQQRAMLPNGGMRQQLTAQQQQQLLRNAAATGSLSNLTPQQIAAMRHYHIQQQQQIARQRAQEAAAVASNAASGNLAGAAAAAA
eukprot:scpid8653/ scgid21592/ Helicase ssl-1; Swi/snf2-like protein 1